VVLLFYYFLIFLPFYSKNGESSPMVDIIILNPIGFYKLYLYIFLRRPILDLKIPLMLRSYLSSDQWYESDLLFVFICMSPMRSRYKELGLNMVDPLQDQPHKTQRAPIAEENKDEGIGDPFKMLLKEALNQLRDVMMDNSSQIL